MIIYIPIKQNSQRVPQKNFREFNGKPLWEHTIDKLKGYKVVIDTDSDSIIKSCKSKEWVTIYKRPKKFRGDKISVVDLIKNYFDKNPTKEIIVQLHVTSPFFDVKHLEEVQKQIRLYDYDSVFSVDVIQNRFWRKEKYGLVPINHNPMKLEQTQDLPKYYMENSYLYAFKQEVLDYGNRIGKNPNILQIEYPYNLDIDTEQDWDIIKSINNTFIFK
jgi:CMP-N-acetylneuraminic acid synthetase